MATTKSTKNIPLTHGNTCSGRRSTEYRAWQAMRTRCNNPKASKYSYYGGRGIKVCERWNSSFSTFLTDMGRRPLGHSLDRFPDNDGNYEPGNVRWANRQQQDNNKRTNHLITFKGETLPIGMWATRLGIPVETISSRLLHLGWSVDRALATPRRRR